LWQGERASTSCKPRHGRAAAPGPAHGGAACRAAAQLVAPARTHMHVLEACRGGCWRTRRAVAERRPRAKRHGRALVQSNSRCTAQHGTARPAARALAFIGAKQSGEARGAPRWRGRRRRRRSAARAAARPRRPGGPAPGTPAAAPAAPRPATGWACRAWGRARSPHQMTAGAAHGGCAQRPARPSGCRPGWGA